MRFLAPRARFATFLSIPSLSPRILPFNRLLLSTLILFVLSMLYIAEVTSGRNVLLPGVRGEIYRLSFLALCSPCTSRGLLSTTTSFCARSPCIVPVFIRFVTVRTIYNANDTQMQAKAFHIKPIIHQLDS